MMQRSRRTAGTLAWLALLVTAAHLWLAGRLLEDQLGDGASRAPRRIEVAFVRELQQQAPPAAIAPPPAAPRRSQPIAAPAAAASAPLLEPVPALPSIEVAAAPAPDPAPAIDAAPPVAPAASAIAEAAPAASAPAAGFEWPPSTRLSYRLTGDYRGPVEGQAQVQWVRNGNRYQVHLDAGIGPSFAPLATRRMTSDGEITADGLRPRRYDEETRTFPRAPRHVTIVFDEHEIRLPGGQVLPLPPGVQDAASQFVQMTWFFTMDPSRLEVGRSVEMPLALPRRVEPWAYDVVGRETLDTPAGRVPALHVRPRRDARPGGDLSAEMWIAPSLQYLPVRIVIRDARGSHLDMLLERLPQQAAEPAAPTTR